jgi:UDP-N-acetyl-D-mannosaminuronic acid transferase (WecB/TagA/CpsF family)
MPTQQNSRAAVLKMPGCSGPTGVSEVIMRRNLVNRSAVQAFKERSLGERPRKQNVKVVLLKGADEANVQRAVERLRKDKPGIEFELVHEPEGDLDISNNTSAVVFVANGSNKGVDRFIEQSGTLFDAERIAVVLVSEHEDSTDRFDHKMTFERAIIEGKLASALQAAHYYKRGEPLN